MDSAFLSRAPPELFFRSKQLQPFGTDHVLSPAPAQTPAALSVPPLPRCDGGKDEANLTRSNHQKRCRAGREQDQQNQVGLAPGPGPCFEEPDKGFLSSASPLGFPLSSQHNPVTVGTSPHPLVLKKLFLSVIIAPTKTLIKTCNLYGQKQISDLHINTDILSQG